ncbi:MAG: hypothetical protein ACFFDH_15200 [Promethearchaeota archaeon]
MKRSTGRAFIFSLIVFLVSNFLFYIISYAIGEILDLVFDTIADHPSSSVFLLIYPSRYFPWELITNSVDSNTFAFKFFYIAGLISFSIAAVVAGLMGSNIGESIGGWMITALCYMLMFIAIIYIDDYNLSYISFSATLIDGIVIILITGAVNALLFGVLVIIIALIRGKK